MEDSILKGVLITATALTGLLCGASLDQSIKQLPARRVIGVKAFSAYAKAADLKSGVAWYAILGIGAALMAISAAILVWTSSVNAPYKLPVYLGGLLSVCHTVCTTQAAPLYFSQKKVTDEEGLNKLFNKFEMIQTIRSAFIVLNFLCYIWLLVILF